MGMERLSDQARELLFEVARMSRGSREGTAGGRGHIGLMKTSDGKMRIVKFDTHGGKSVAGMTSSNDLRRTLMEIANAAGLRQDVLAEIRQKLGIVKREGEDYLAATSLLDRTVSAKVVELIGGRRIWGEAGYNKATYTSGKDTSFETVSSSDRNSGNVRTVASVEKGGNRQRETAFNIIRTKVSAAIISLPFESKEPVRALVDRVLSDALLRKAWDKCISANEFKAVAMKTLFRILMAKGGVDGGNPEASLKNQLQRCADDTGELLKEGWWADLEKDKAVLNWCAEHGAQHAEGHEDRDEDTLLEETLKRALEEDVSRGDGGSKPAACAFRAGGHEAGLQNVGASMAAALKGVLGVKDNAPGVALRELNMFAAFAREYGNSGDFYMKFGADGKTLASAGSRNILRGSGSKAENNDVRQRLMECVSDFYDGNIPQSVKAVMTGFDGKGHPLSAKRVGLIKAAIDADRLQKAYPCKISLNALAGTGLTLEDFNEALGQLAARYHLSEDEQQVVGKMTLAYLASRAEENDPDIPMPDAATLKRQIADGSCNGTFYGLERLRKIPLVKAETDIRTTGDRINTEDNELVFMLNSEDVEEFAYFAGKFLPVGDSLSSFPYNGPGVLVLKDLVDHKDELLAFRSQHGKMTLGDLWRLRLGETMPEVPRYHQQRGFQLALYKKWMADFDRLHGFDENHSGIREKMRLNILTDNPDAIVDDEMIVEEFSNKCGYLVRPVVEFDLTLDDAGLLYLGKNVDHPLDISPKASAYNTNSQVFRTATQKDLLFQLGGDLRRYAGKGSFDVFSSSEDKQPLHIDIPQMQMDNQKLKELADENAKTLYRQFCDLLGCVYVEEEGNDENSNPPPPPPAQLKTLVLLSGQAGNTSLTLAGVQGNDHYPTDKTFTKLDNGQVRFTVAATVGNRRVSVTYDIAQDGTSTCRGMMAQNVEPPPQA